MIFFQLDVLQNEIFLAQIDKTTHVAYGKIKYAFELRNNQDIVYIHNIFISP